MTRRTLFFGLPAFMLIVIVWNPSLAIGGNAGNSLIAYPGAKGLRRPGKAGQIERLSYHLDISYPATGMIDFISGKLQRAGWKPLSYDFFDPKTYPAGMRKWGYYLESLKHPVICIHTWIGDWKDDSGDVVRYTFFYKHRGCRTSDLSGIEVIGMYVPAAVARQIGELVQKDRR